MTRAFLIDMDGVLVRGSAPIPGAEVFIDRLNEAAIPYFILTNNSRYTPQKLSERLKAAGLNVSERHIFSSAIATAIFLEQQQPGGSAFVVGGPGLMVALEAIGYRLEEADPDFVVLGETIGFDFEAITKALRLVHAGKRFISTNPDLIDPGESGVEPACGSIAAMISAATGVQPYSIGKPNPLMMRCALNLLDTRAADTTIIGDRMDTDIIAGMESGLETVLVLSGVTALHEIDRYPFRPDHIQSSVGDLVEDERFWT